MTTPKKDTKTTKTTEEPTVTVDGRKITWGYSKKVQTADYESHEVSIYMTDVPPQNITDVPQWLTDHTTDSFDLLKVEVWGALGLDVEFTPEGHPQLVKVATAPPRPIEPAPAPVQGVPVSQVTPAPAPIPGAAVPGTLIGVYAETPVFCKDCSKTEFFDNRAAMDQNIQAGKKIGPDFKCKACDGGNGNGKPIYRPGSYDYNKTVGQAPAVAPAMTPPAPAEEPVAPVLEYGPGEAPF